MHYAGARQREGLNSVKAFAELHSMCMGGAESKKTEYLTSKKTNFIKAGPGVRINRRNYFLGFIMLFRSPIINISSWLEVIS